MTPTRAIKKLQQARGHLDRMQHAASGDEFTAAFSAFLASIRSIPDALRKDLKGKKNWRSWADTKEAEMHADSLIQFLFDLRNEDVHEGEHRLEFATRIEDMTVSAPPGGVIVLGADGVYAVYDQGKPTERREPVRQGRYTTAVGIANPPDLHCGRAISDKSPPALCGLAISYFENVLADAAKSFK